MNRNRWPVAAALVVAIVAAASLFAGRPGPAETPALLAVQFHADWCASCRRLAPVFDDLRNRTRGKPVLFVVFDRTDRATTAQAG